MPTLSPWQRSQPLLFEKERLMRIFGKKWQLFSFSILNEIGKEIRTNFVAVR
jgi:hypothetical protein